MAKFCKTPGLLLSYCIRLQTFVEAELHWEPLECISSRRSRAEHGDYSLVLKVRLNHDPYKYSILAFLCSAELVSNQHSDSLPGCGKLLSKSAFNLASFLSLKIPISYDI